MNYPLSKYKFYVAGDRVIACSTYAGRIVRGVAKCAPDDTFDLEKGKQIAAARCNLKIAEKRLKRATMRRKQATKAFNDAFYHYNAMNEYCADAMDAVEGAKKELNNLI